MSDLKMDIRCSGLVFKREQRQKIQVIAEQIYAFAPSDSTLRLIFDHGDRGFKVFGRVTSQAGQFSAEANSGCPVEAMRDLQSQLSEQFSFWKQQRSFSAEHAS